MKTESMKMKQFKLALLLLLMASCSGIDSKPADHDFETAKRMIAQGDHAHGMTLLKTLADSLPQNSQYRNALKMQQSLLIGRLINQAESALHNADEEAATLAYQQILEIDPANERGKAGMEKLVVMQNHAMMLTNARSAYEKNDADSAKSLVRAILAEDSQHIEARALFELIDQQRSDKVTAVPQIKSALQKNISLELKNVPIKSVFEYIAKVSKLNFSYDQELRDERTSLFVRDTTIEDAIEVVLTTNQLAKKILNENTLLIYPISRSSEYQEQFVRSFYLNNMDAKRAQNLIKTVLKSKDIYIDEKLNTLVMRDSAEAIQIAEKLIASQDLADPEVMLEVEVMEINRRNLEEIGVIYPTQVGLGVQGNSTSNGTTTKTPGRLSLAELKQFNSGLGVFTINDPVLAMNLLQQNTDTNLLANPQIRVKNRDKAKIHVGDKIPVLTSVANSTGFVSQTVSYIDVGIKLDVEPTIMLQNQVSIKVGLEVSNVTDQVKTDSGVLAYTIGSRNANTTLQLRDGETQILAGLFRDDSQNISNKVPGLSSLPLIGRLFTNNNKDKRKNEIVLLITPRILHNIAPAHAVYTSFPSGVNHATGRNGRNSQAVESQPVAITNTVAPTPQSVQANQAAIDQNFASQLMQPGSPTGNATANPVTQ